MRNKLINYLLAGVFALAGFSSAVANADEDHNANRLSIAGVWENIQLKDAESDNEKTNFTGGGVFGSYTYGKVWEPYFQLRGAWMAATSNRTHSAATVDAAGGEFSTFTHSVSAELRVGYVFPLWDLEGWTVTPYTGYGYFGSKTHVAVSAAEVNFRVRGQVVPVGVVVHYDINKDWCVELDVQAAWITHGTAKLSDNTNAAATFDDKLSNRVQWGVELPIRYHLADQWDLTLVPNFAHASMRSDLTGASQLDETANVWGARLELGYCF